MSHIFLIESTFQDTRPRLTLRFVRQPPRRTATEVGEAADASRRDRRRARLGMCVAPSPGLTPTEERPNWIRLASIRPRC